MIPRELLKKLHSENRLVNSTFRPQPAIVPA